LFIFVLKTGFRILKYKIMQTINITAYTEDNSQIEAVKAVMKALKIKFEISEEKPYNPEFVAEIKRSEADFKNGKFTTVKVEDLNNYIDNL
jgi:hypothetical protein